MGYQCHYVHQNNENRLEKWKFFAQVVCPVLHLFTARGASGGWNDSPSKSRPTLHLFPPLFLSVAVEKQKAQLPSWSFFIYLFIFWDTVMKNSLNLLLKCFYYTSIKFSYRTLDEFSVRLQVIALIHLVLIAGCWCWGLSKI